MYIEHIRILYVQIFVFLNQNDKNVQDQCARPGIGAFASSIYPAKEHGKTFRWKANFVMARFNF